MRSFDQVGPDTDIEEATAALADAYASRWFGRGQFTQEDAERLAAERLALAFTAAELGHVVTWVPGAAITSAGIRWGCVNCGRSVLQLSAANPPYGAVLDERCPEEAPA